MRRPSPFAIGLAALVGLAQPLGCAAVNKVSLPQCLELRAGSSSCIIYLRMVESWPRS